MRRALARTPKRIPLSGAAAHVRTAAESSYGRSRAVSHAPPALSFEVREILEGLARGEFEAYFQPKVEMRTLRVRGAAALARWNRPRTGIVRPHGFVPALEEAGEPDALTRFMLTAAAALRERWRARGDAGSIAVSVSLRSLAGEQLIGDLVDAMESGELDPRGLVLDVTAPVPAHDAHGAVEHIMELHARGFAISVDSYGHGYLSMQQLVDVPFTQLKIAAALTECARRHESARSILASSVAAARIAGVDVIAERLETREDWDLMTGIGCDMAQGNYIAEPMAAGDFLQWLQQQGAFPRAAPSTEDEAREARSPS